VALKNIRVTFYYSDEAVFAKTKQWKTRLRTVTWANEFYKRYGFKIDEYPLPYNEGVYKKTFCLRKTNGLKADYTRAVYYEAFKEALDKERIEVQRESDELSANPPADPAEHIARSQALLTRMKTLLANMEHLLAFLTEIRPDEIEFRKEIRKKVEDTKFRPKKERLVVIFCEFINWLAIFRGNRTIAQAFKNEQNQASFMAWNLISILFPAEALFTGPIIWIDVNRVTRQFDYVLAHEIVHAAGNTTLDNQGSAGNIMIYADAQGKAPKDVKLEPTDKAKLEAAYFVV
jgi:hypothetical protein